MTSFTNLSSARVYHGDPMPVPLGVGERRNHCPVSYRVSYINDLPYDVTVVWRSGFSFRIPSEHSGRVNKFIARLEISVHSSVKVDVHRLLSALEQTASAELLAMKQAVESQIADNPYGGLTITVDYPITLEALQQRGGAVYYSELDTVVSILSARDTPFHPFSDHGAIQQAMNGAGVTSKQNGFVYNLDVVDNHGRFGTRFLNIGGSVYRIDTRKDFTRRDGIYLTTSGNCEGELGGGMPVARRICFDKGVPALCLYRTYDEASAYGDEETVRKRVEQLAEQKTLLLKRELQDQKQQHDLEKLESERKLREEAAEQERASQRLKREREEFDLVLETRRAQVKDSYDVRAYERKDNSETVKYLPSLIVGVGAAFMALKSILP